MKQQPMSQRLNDFIINRAKNIQYVSGAFKEVDFETFKAMTKSYGFMPISNEHCEGTIFANPEVNVMFRAWHDQTHIDLNEGFDYAQEVRVAFKQCAELPQDWHFERMLIMSEIAGQAAYHDKYKDFVPDQIAFTNELLTSGNI